MALPFYLLKEQERKTAREKPDPQSALARTQRRVDLSWAIIEAKILYYDPKELPESFVERKLPSDARYDAMEREYLDLCVALNQPNTVVHKEYAGLRPRGAGMFELDWERPSVKLAHEKLLREAFPERYVHLKQGRKPKKKLPPLSAPLNVL